MPDQALINLIAQTGPILLDFDGPVTQLLPPPLNARMAEAARRPLIDAHAPIPPDVLASTDHIGVLRYAGTIGGDVQNDVEAMCIACEVGAAGKSSLTPGADDVLDSARLAGRPVVVVSNNHQAAVEAFLDRLGLLGLVWSVFGRPDGHPDLMKPHPHMLNLAIRQLGVPAAHCLMIGDSVSDVDAGHAAGTGVLGYAKTAERGRELAEAGADALFNDNRALAEAIRGSG